MYQPFLRVLLRKKGHKYLYPHPHGLLILKGSEKQLASFIVGEAFHHPPSSAHEDVLEWIEEEAPIMANCKGRRGRLLKPPENYLSLMKKVFEKRPEFSLAKELVISSFIESLLAYKEHEEEIRVCRTSLVISEEYFKQSLDRYKPYLQKRYGYGKSKARRLRDKLKSMFEEDMYYLSSGSFCLKGRLLRLRSHYDGLDLLEQEDGDLHPYENRFWQDPAYSAIPYYRAVQDGLYWYGVITVRESEYQLTRHVVEQWEDRYEGAYGQAPSNSVKALTELAATLQQASVVKMNRKKRVRAFLRHQKEATYLAADGWVFVVVDDNKLATCYFVGDLESQGFTYQENTNQGSTQCL